MKVREVVREFLKELEAAVAKKDDKEIMKVCDDIRDIKFAQIGIRILDRKPG